MPQPTGEEKLRASFLQMVKEYNEAPQDEKDSHLEGFICDLYFIELLLERWKA
jgi:hypothetical protein